LVINVLVVLVPLLFSPNNGREELSLWLSLLTFKGSKWHHFGKCL